MPIVLRGLAPPSAATTAADSALTGYRADIDGLRALAVVPVVLFHSELGIVSGGFVGVDIFFVISGYLITQLLLAAMTGDRFSLADFYERRIRRIFPALFFVLVACGVAGLIVMLPRDLETLGKNLIAAATSLSNVALWFQDDYFAGSSKLKPMLHTWSLGLEEQFYLFWPLILFALVRFARRHMVPITAAAALLSFAVSVWMTDHEQSAAFYLLPYRAWELLLGALLAMGAVPRFGSRALAQVAGGAGLVLILYAVIAFSEAMPFPGFAAAIPCLGAALIIHAGEERRATVASGLLSHPVAVFGGKISYSFYLWHWPLFVFARYSMIEEPPPALMFEIALVSMLCAALSWRFVEEPFRRKMLLTSRRAVFAAGAGVMIAAVAFGGVLVAAHGFPQRVDAETARLAAATEHPNPYAIPCHAGLLLKPACVIGDPARLRYALVGDSHAMVLRGAMERIAETGPATLYGGASRCPPLAGFGSEADCLAANAQKLQFLQAHPEIDTVIVASRWTYYYRGRALGIGPAETNGDLPDLIDARGIVYRQFTPAAQRALTRGITDLVGALLAANKTVVLVYPIPEVGHDVPFTLARLHEKGKDVEGFTIPEEQYIERQADTIAMLDGLGRHPRLRRVYPAAILCHDGACATVIGGIPLYTDNNHLSAAGARLLAPAIVQATQQ
ncbi:acyltransferase [Sphingopyxis indica]|uniref:acyltransferase family protein n=1 Tax=Sphingopyxis indica TaxID=436663 RepID=UPI0029391DBF|nr:acyltransferase family protein [Sphingopyxis indica]WOF43564.1 acyltransferase [Sphingopyxis indica]